MVKLISSVCLVLLLAACSSTPMYEGLNCGLFFYRTIDDRKSTYKMCSILASKDKEKDGYSYKKGSSYWGVVNVDKNKWFIKPLYEQIPHVDSTSALVRMPGDKFLKKLHFDSWKTEDTQIVSVENIYLNFEQKNGKYVEFHNLFIMGENKDQLGFYHYSSGEILNTVKDVDVTIKDKFGKDVLAVYVGIDRGFIVRHNVNGEKFYKIYSWNGIELTKEKIPADEVEFFNVAHYSNEHKNKTVSVYFPMRKLHNKANLYWPLMFSASEYFEQPEDIDGIYLEKRPNKSQDFDSVNKMYVKEGDNVYPISLDTLPYDLKTRKAIVVSAKKRIPIKNVAEIEFVAFKDVGSDNQIRTTTIELVHRLDGNYTVGTKDVIYNAKTEAMAYIKQESALAATRSYQQQMVQYEKDMEKYKREKAAYDEAIAKQNNFINFIHQNGIGASGNSAGYDAEVYCSYGGPRCESYRRQAQNMQDTHNRNAEAANRNRLNNLYNGETASERQQREKNAACRKRANTLNEHAGKRTYTCD